MNLLRSLFQKKPKRDLFHGLLLNEIGFTHFIFEKSSTEVSIDYEDAHKYSHGFDKILDDVDEALFNAENRVNQKINSIIFFVPTYAVDSHNKEVAQPFRRAISEIVKNLELDAMGYIEMFDIFKGLLPTHAYTYVEIGSAQTLIGVASEDTLSHRSSIDTSPANIGAKVRKLSHAGSPVIIESLNQLIAEKVSQELGDYTCTILTQTDFNLGVLQLLQTQLLTTTSEPTEKAIDDTVAVSTPDDDEMLQQQVAARADQEVVLSKHTLDAVDDTDEYTGNVDTQQSAEALPHASSRHQLKHGSVVRGFTIHQPSKKTSSQILANADKTILEPMLADEQDTVRTSDTADEVDRYSDETTVEVGETPASTPKRRSRPVWMLYIPAVLICILVLAGLYEYFFHIVKVEIFMPTKAYQKEIRLLGVPVNKTIEEKEVSVDIQTTGKRDIGERAKGQVSILNFQNKVASMSAGTKFYIDEREYQLDADILLDPAKINIEKRSIEASSRTAPASATFIGTEGNIAKGTQLTFEEIDPSVMVGVVESAFSGGSSRTVSAVSADDIKSVRQALSEKAKEATSSIRGQKPQGMITLDSISKVEVGDIDFSASSGQVTSRLSGTAVVNSELYTVQKAFIEERASLELTKSNRYAKSSGDVSQYTFDDITITDSGDTADMTLVHKTQVYTSVPIDEVKKLLYPSLKTPMVDTLKRELKSTKITVSDISAFKIWDGYMPIFKKNIDITISPDR